MSEPERAASALLKKHGIVGPPVDVANVTKLLGISLQLADLGEDCSGMLVRAEGGAVIGVHFAHPPNRQRFTIAHELGHFVLHEGGTYVDRGTTLRLRSVASNSGSIVEEREANQFAAALLMPAAWLRREVKMHAIDLGDDESLRLLCERFGVSNQAMMYRLMNLRLLDDASSPS
ncbi:MAG: ImmA/IrrE family metallo-endopeptidase [Gemmatimonadetes bacterium]|nr:ImmA/IrrE family metallo-endopeptidase [Gemmatimonadota bacterium]